MFVPSSSRRPKKEVACFPVLQTVSLFLSFYVRIASSQVIYTALSPKTIRPRTTYELFLSVENSPDSDPSPVSFEINIVPGTEKIQREDFHVNWKSMVLNTPNGKVVNATTTSEPKPLAIIHEELKIVPGSSASVKLAFTDLPESFYNMTIKTSSEKGVISEDFAILHVEYKDLAILLQTDKPIYKPGETVHFRVLFVDRNLRPVNFSGFGSNSRKSISIKLLDSHRNIIRVWNEVKPSASFGMVKESVQLSPEPNLGEWTLEVAVKVEDSKNSTENLVENSHTFKIDQYILPKFKVEIKPKPSFVTYNESKFILQISSTYTHGKPVKGECTVELLSNEFAYSFIENGDFSVGSIGDENDNAVSVPTTRGPKKVSKTLEITGEGYLEFDLKTDLKIRYEDAYEFGQEYTIKASCHEQVSGKAQNTTGKIILYKYPYKISVVDPPAKYKPGFHLTLTIKVASQDDTPISDKSPEALKIEHGFSYDSAGGIMTKPIPPTGLVVATFTTPTNEFISISSFDVTYKNLTQSMSVPMRQSSPSKTYMQISSAGGTQTSSVTVEVEGNSSTQAPVKVGDTVPITVRINKPFDNLHYVLTSRGLILTSERVSFPKKSNEQIITLKVPPAASPKATLIVYAVVGPNNEIVVDDISIDVAVSTDRLLKISVAPGGGEGSTVEPGTSISINCEGLAQSLIALRGVDQSVLLFTEDKDITKNSLKSVEDSFDEKVSSNRVYGGSDAFQTFEQVGLHLLTNGLMKKQEVAYASAYRGQGFRKNKMMAVGMMASAPMMMDMAAEPLALASVALPSSFGEGGFGGGSSQIPIRIRSSFPESWIFSEIESSSEGKAVLEQTVPDTITSWIINGFQINGEAGIGLTAAPTKLVVFRPFFLTLVVPYAIVQGEVLALQVLVHNYMGDAVQAKIVLENSKNELEFLEGQNKTGRTEMVKEVMVNGSSVVAVIFLIVSNKIGTITLSVKGTTGTAGDGLTQPLIVRPPGVKHVRNHVVFLNLIQERTQTKEITAIFPEKRVPGADSLKVSVIGDVLGGTIHNLDSLIQLPTGCGEQNMLKFVPDIVVLEYLNATNDLRPDIERKATTYLEQGYQRQLTYRRSDGSFSAFGNADPGGSTWLTAFVAKSFISAKGHIYVDDAIILSALEFLIQQQAESGSFVEEGKILHMGIQGGANHNDDALTAYCLIAFVEAKAAIQTEKFNYDKIVESGVKLLMNEYKKSKFSQNLYTINLVAYLLHLMDHPQKNELFKTMDEHAKSDAKGELKYWLVTGERNSEGREFSNKISPFYWNPWEPHVRPASIEITAYALMTYLIRGKSSTGKGKNVEDSIPIARWLMKQRNENGGFLSTQDTVVGITALSQFAQAIRTPKDKYKVQITAQWNSEQGKGKKRHDFFIGTDNMTVLQEYFLSDGVKSVDVTGTGVGTALAQLTWTYYTVSQSNATGFTLSVIVQGKDKNRRLEMAICTIYQQEGQSHMAILEVRTPTGYAFDNEELIEMRNQHPSVMRQDLEDRDTKLNIYFSSLQFGHQVCLKINTYRLYLVAKHSKASVVVYDYYDTTRRAQKFYEAPKIDACSICKADITCKMNNCL